MKQCMYGSMVQLWKLNTPKLAVLVTCKKQRLLLPFYASTTDQHHYLSWRGAGHQWVPSEEWVRTPLPSFWWLRAVPCAGGEGELPR